MSSKKAFIRIYERSPSKQIKLKPIIMLIKNQLLHLLNLDPHFPHKWTTWSKKLFKQQNVTSKFVYWFPKYLRPEKDG